MAATSPKFLKGVVDEDGLPTPSRPTVAFFGRSNVGKSSVINSLFGRKELARSSSTPGRTTEINYYLVDGRWYLADLPGYGYARLPGTIRDRIAAMLSWYASCEAVDLRFAVLVIDASIGIQDSDRETYELLLDRGHPVVIVANKSDKGRRNDAVTHLRDIRTAFPESPVIRYSAKTGEGRSELSVLIRPTP